MPPQSKQSQRTPEAPGPNPDAPANVETPPTGGDPSAATPQAQTPSDPKPPEQPKASGKSQKEGGYVVLVDMVTLSVPGRRPGTIAAERVGKGALVYPDADLNDVQYLLDLKAIAPDDGSAYKRTTPTVLAQAAGGIDDPVQVPVNLFDVTDDDVTPEDEDDDDD